MAVPVKQQINTQFMNDVQKAFPVAKVQKAVEKMADEAISIMRERCNQGIDVNGKRFAPYSKAYAKYKKKYIKSGTKVNEFGATRMPNHIRLSGALFGAMKRQIIAYAQNFNKNDKISTSFRLYIDGSQEKKVKGLLATTGRNKYKSYSKKARQFFGIATQGSRAVPEQNRLINKFQSEMGFKVSGSRNNMIFK